MSLVSRVTQCHLFITHTNVMSYYKVTFVCSVVKYMYSIGENKIM